MRGFLASLVCICIALVNARHHPVRDLGNNVVIDYTILNGGEGTSVAHVLQYAGDVGVVTLNTSAPGGWYATYKNFGTGQLAITYIANGYPTCYLGSLGPPYSGALVPYRPFQHLSFTAYGTYRGRTVGRYESGYMSRHTSFNAWGLVDNTTGDPLLFYSGFQSRTVEYNAIHRDAFPANATTGNTPSLALPQSCFTPNGTIGADEVASLLRVDPHFSEDVMGVPKMMTGSKKIAKKSASVHSQLQTKGRVSMVAAALQDAVDNRRFAGPIQNQGFCGACWAFASSTAALVVFNKRSNTTATKTARDLFSPQDLIDCVSGSYPRATGGFRFYTKGCVGGNPYVSFKRIISAGIASLVEYPFIGVNGVQCRQSVTRQYPVNSVAMLAPGNVTAIRDAIRDNGAVTAMVNAPYSFLYYGGSDSQDDGVFDDSDCTPGTGHVVVLVGYGVSSNGTPYWVLLNSFGAAWGRRGYMRIRAGVNRCGVEALVAAPS